MNFRKAIAAGDRRPTRFHTQRGEFAGYRQLPQFIRVGMRRALNREPDLSIPWMSEGAVKRLEGLLNPTMTVIELGSGASTAWYAARAQSVLSLETNPDWHARTLEMLSNLSNVDLRLTQLTKLTSLLADVGHSFDVAIVDHNEELGGWSRVDSIRALEPHITTILVLDNSDRPEYRPADHLMSAWAQERFSGFPGPALNAAETTIYLKQPFTGAAQN